MYSQHKNSYLQTTIKEINPSIINRSVQLAREHKCVDEHDSNPPFNRLTSEQPTIPVKNIDLTRRPLGYGRWAMPKLRRELHDKDLTVVLAAITSIYDLVHDPEYAFQAINLNIIDRMVDLIIHEQPEIRERTALTLTILAGQGAGRAIIVSNKYLIDNIAAVVEEENKHVRMKVATLIEMIAIFWKAADILVENGFVQLLLDNLLKEEDEIIEMHLQSLKSLMYGVGKDIAIENDAYCIFIKLLDRIERPKILQGACQCLMILTSTKAGEKLAESTNILMILTRLLYDERPEVHTSAASALMFATTKTKAKIAASKIKQLPKRLVELARNKLNPSTQVYAIKALTNVCEHPEVRKLMKTKYSQQLNDIELGDDPNLKEYKNILMTIVGWLPTSAE